MKFLVDAQLPRRFAYWLQNQGHDAVHTLDLPTGNRTADYEIASIADAQERVVVTKDDDFVESYVLTGKPRRLLLISLGNTSNAELERSLMANLETIVQAFEFVSNFVELTRSGVILHD